MANLFLDTRPSLARLCSLIDRDGKYRWCIYLVMPKEMSLDTVSKLVAHKRLKDNHHGLRRGKP